MNNPELTASIQAELISRQRHEITALRHENERLNSGMAKLSKILTIALQDSGASIVINQARYNETIPSFTLGENIGGDTLVYYRRVQK